VISASVAGELGAAVAGGLVDGWLAEQRAMWQDRTDRLDRFVTRQEPS